MPLRHGPLCPPEVPSKIGLSAHSGDLLLQGNLCWLSSLTSVTSYSLSFLKSPNKPVALNPCLGPTAKGEAPLASLLSSSHCKGTPGLLWIPLF